MKEKLYLDFATLPEEDKKQIAKMEKETEELYRLRGEMYSQWADMQSDLKPTVVEEEFGDKVLEFEHSLTLNDLLFTDEKYWSQFIDEDKLRESIIKKTKLEDKNKIESQLKFQIDRVLFNFRELVKLRREVLGIDSEEEPKFPKEVREFYKFRVDEYKESMAKVHDFNARMEELNREITIAKDLGDDRWAHKMMDELKGTEEKYEEFIHNEPEAFLAVAYTQLINMRRSFDEHGRVVETPYVLQITTKIGESLAQGNTVFVHGELGAGKTEIVKYMCRKDLSHDYLERWENGDESLKLKPHPRPDRKDFYSQKEYAKAREDWEAEREIAKEPYVISGHKSIDTDVFLGSIKIERLLKMTPEEQVILKAEKREEFEGTLKERYPAWDEDKIKKAMHDFDLSLDRFLANPVETVPYLGKFYLAMKEGRPIILDEMNAIPHHVLIMLNDLMTKKPGDIVKPMIDDMPAFEVKSGFYFIGTGNWRPEGGGEYSPREKMDAAYLSRLDLIDYDYLPNAVTFAPMENAVSEEDKIAKQVLRQNNQLFQMMLVRLMNKDGALRIPPEKTYRDANGKEIVYTEGWRQVYSLAVMARIIEDLYSGRKVPKEFFPDTGAVQVDPKEFLKENVLSLRHLIPVLEDWRHNSFARPIDDYIFRYYISRSSARPEEMTFLYQLLQTQGGFFDPNKGWPDAAEDQGRADLMRLGAVKDEDMYKSIEMSKGKSAKAHKDFNAPLPRTMSALDSIRLLFGELPSRKRVAEKTEETAEPELDMLTKGEVDELMGDIEDIETSIRGHADSPDAETISTDFLDEADLEKKTGKKG